MDIGSILIVLIIILVVVVAIGLVFGGIYYIFFSPKALRRRALKRQAKHDYQSARGTAHLKLLLDAKERLQNEHNELSRKLNLTRETLQNKREETRNLLKAVLIHHIANSYLQEVPGIGPKLHRTILDRVFRSSLQDFRYAYQVHGVGESKQLEINYWVDKYEKRIPKMLKKDFPGKAEIEEEYEQEVDNLKKRIKICKSQLNQLDTQLVTVQPEIDKLQKVKEKDFINLLVRQTVYSEAIDHYFKGVFAEWEPMPEWFKEVISMGNK